MWCHGILILLCSHIFSYSYSYILLYTHIFSYIYSYIPLYSYTHTLIYPYILILILLYTHTHSLMYPCPNPYSRSEVRGGDHLHIAGRFLHAGLDHPHRQHKHTFQVLLCHNVRPLICSYKCAIVYVDVDVDVHINVLYCSCRGI
jgi:hypothetical protein